MKITKKLALFATLGLLALTPAVLLGVYFLPNRNSSSAAFERNVTNQVVERIDESSVPLAAPTSFDAYTAGGTVQLTYLSQQKKRVKPIVQQQISEEPVTEEPATEEPATEEPTTEETTTEEPATEEPATEEPTTEEPATEEPATEDPATEEPATEEPATEEPATEDPATEEPATEEPATEEPATEEPATEEPATEEPATEEPATEEPATEEPATEEPATEEPATEEPATEEPATEEPATEEPEEEEPEEEEPEEEEPAVEEPTRAVKPSDITDVNAMAKYLYLAGVEFWATEKDFCGTTTRPVSTRVSDKIGGGTAVDCPGGDTTRVDDKGVSHDSYAIADHFRAYVGMPDLQYFKLYLSEKDVSVHKYGAREEVIGAFYQYGSQRATYSPAE
ncbi:MAG: hypothetical protein ABFD03_12310 [Clostridiaceae bacterium]